MSAITESEKPEPAEEWRPVPAHEGLYEVSDLGRVRSLPRPSTRGGLRILTRNPKGHLWLEVSSHGKRTKWLVHRLVAAVFIGPCPPGQEVRHLDGNPANNRPGNLAYGTSSQNSLDSVRHGTHPEASRTHCDNGHEYTPENTHVSPAGHRVCLQCRRNRDRARPADQAARRAAATEVRRRERLKARDRAA